ncbi:MAG: signal peptidase II [Planctomycetota bacterium]|jgi:signal peptidase II|nr:signal peptidase II [Planctomycetota bacterium]
MARNATGWNPPTGWLLFGGIASAAAVIDLVTKSLLFARLGMPGLRPGIVLVPRMLSLETNLNEGALFGMGQGMGLFFAGVSVAAIAGITAVMSRRATRDDPWLVVALALVTGGIIGNLYDRLGLPGLQWHAPLERVGKPVLAVRDWIHFELPGIIDWPIFNLADTWLVIGAALLMLVSLRTPPENQSAS